MFDMVTNIYIFDDLSKTVRQKHSKELPDLQATQKKEMLAPPPPHKAEPWKEDEEKNKRQNRD